MKLTNEQKRVLVFIGIGVILTLLGFLVDEPVDKLMRILQFSTVTYISQWVSYVLSLIVVLLIMTSMFMWEENKKDWILPLWSSAITAFIVSYLLKFLVARDRPIGPIEFFGFIDAFSFPSAHAAISFAVIPILDKEYPMFKLFWIGFAVAVALSRVYLGVHFLSDVIAGAVIGYAIGKFMIFVKEKHSFFW